MPIPKTFINTNPNNLTLSEIREKNYKNGYEMAIDDFVESVKNLIADSSVIRFKDIDEIAEQLKAGGENGKERS